MDRAVASRVLTAAQQSVFVGAPAGQGIAADGMAPKRKSLTIQEKFDIVSRLEEGAANIDLCKKLTLPSSTISTIWKCRDKIKRRFETDSAQVKKLRGTRYKDVDEFLFTWFKLQRSNKFLINGPILLEQARKFAVSLGHDSAPDSSWVQRFRKRHNIELGKISSGSSSAPTKAKEEWLKKVWPKIRDGYLDDEVFNAREIGLFYKLLPDQTFQFKGEKCSDGKLSKDRMTVMVATNMTGTEKRKLLVIARSKNPRCFKHLNIKRLPVGYTSDKRSLMTSEIFETFLRSWDEELQKKETKILLIVDNCPAHSEVKNLKQIKLVFLPLNTKSFHPLDQGIIKSLKMRFRKHHVLRTIKNIEENRSTTITVLDAIRMLSRAWNDISETTVQNCFRHAGFESLDKKSPPDSSESCDEDINEWARYLSIPRNLQIYDFNEYVSVDDNLTVTCLMTNDETLSSLRREEQDDTEEDKSVDDGEPPTPVSLNTARMSLEDVRRYLGSSADVPSNVDAALSFVEEYLDSVFYAQRRNQSK